MIISNEEIENAAEKYSHKRYGKPSDWQEVITTAKSFDRDIQNTFIAGAEFLESKWNEYFTIIITENQGLKLYKDREAERFKELAIEFAKWYRESLRIDEIKYPSIELEFDLEGKSFEELYEIFLKERNENN